jgi:hypothetical protein
MMSDLAAVMVLYTTPLGFQSRRIREDEVLYDVPHKSVKGTESSTKLRLLIKIKYSLDTYFINSLIIPS